MDDAGSRSGMHIHPRYDLVKQTVSVTVEVCVCVCVRPSVWLLLRNKIYGMCDRKIEEKRQTHAQRICNSPLSFHNIPVRFRFFSSFVSPVPPRSLSIRPRHPINF